MALRVVTAAVIEREGLILVAQRPEDKHYPLQWEFPGGKLAPGESPEQGLAREVREELGVEVEVLEPLGVVRHTYSAEHDYLLLFYRCRIVAGEPVPQPGQGIKRLEWAARERLPSYDWLAGDRAFVERLARSGP